MKTKIRKELTDEIQQHDIKKKKECNYSAMTSAKVTLKDFLYGIEDERIRISIYQVHRYFLHPVQGQRFFRRERNSMLTLSSLEQQTLHHGIYYDVGLCGLVLEFVGDAARDSFIREIGAFNYTEA